MRGIEDFAGEWLLERRISDLRQGLTGELQGRASVVQDGGGLWRYREEGLLRYGDAAPVQAVRVYLWRQQGALIAVAFDDGRPFHAFDPNAAAPRAQHDCAPDLYDVRYDFGAWPAWRAVWQVQGPRKDYRMESVYRRG